MKPLCMRWPLRPGAAKQGQITGAFAEHAQTREERPAVRTQAREPEPQPVQGIGHLARTGLHSASGSIPLLALRFEAARAGQMLAGG